MDCPRCQLMLRETDYESVAVDICDNCWGMWLDKGELLDIVKTRDMRFSGEERRQVLNLSGHTESSPADNLEAVPCPKCRRPMEEVASDAGVHIVIDRCPDHGIWLDAGEIKAVQAVAEKSGKLHRMIIEKLGLREH